MAEDAIRRRAACDRCHAQKIRCPRKPGEEVCDRCMKARTPCIFSPFRQKKVPEADGEADDGVAISPDPSSISSNEHDDAARSTIGAAHRKRRRTPTPHMQIEDSIDLDRNLIFGASTLQVDGSVADINWMSNSFPLSDNFPDPTFDDVNLAGQMPFLPLDFTSLVAGSQHEQPLSPKIDSRVQSLREANMSRTIKTTSNISDSLPPQPSFRDLIGNVTKWGQTFEILEPESESNCIRKLSQLSIDLFEHSNTIPPLSIYDSPSTNPEDNPVYFQPQAYQDYSAYRVDETFRLTQNLVDIYPTFLSAFLPHPVSQSSDANSTWTSDRMSNTYFETAQHPTTGSSKSSTLQTLDHSSILLILSCHLRLIDIYEALFAHMGLCFEQGGIPKTPQQTTLNVPQMKIGDFAPPPSAAIPMQMLLLVQFATRLSNYAADLASEIREPEQGTPQSDSSNGSSSNETLALTRAAAENVKSRANTMSQEISTMRVRALQSGHFA